MQLVLSQSRWLRFGSFSAFYFAQGVPIGCCPSQYLLGSPNKDPRWVR